MKVLINECTKKISALSLAVAVAVLSIPIVAKANDNVDVTTITEYVDIDGDGYVDVDSMYAGYPVTSQTVTEEGFVITCYDVPELATLSTESEYNWYYDSIVIGYGDYYSVTRPIKVIDGPFTGAFSISVPYDSNYVSKYYCVSFVSSLSSSEFCYSNKLSLDLSNYVVISSDNLSTYSYCWYLDYKINASYSVGSYYRNTGNITLTDGIGSIKTNHSQAYNSLILQDCFLNIAFYGPNTYGTTYTIDFTCVNTLKATDTHGLDVEVDPTTVG